MLELEEMLRQDKSRIEEKLKVLRDMDFGNSPGRDNEEADETEEMSNKLGTIKALEGRVSDIEASLKRIADGAYGICLQCGKDIELEVLVADPEGALCKECKV